MGAPVEGWDSVKDVAATSYNADFIPRCKDLTTNSSVQVSLYLIIKSL